MLKERMIHLPQGGENCFVLSFCPRASTNDPEGIPNTPSFANCKYLCVHSITLELPMFYCRLLRDNPRWHRDNSILVICLRILGVCLANFMDCPRIKYGCGRKPILRNFSFVNNEYQVQTLRAY